MRKLGIAVLALLGVLVAVLLALPYVLDVNRYRGRIEAELEKRLGRDVSLGNMRLSLLPLAFRVENATIAEDPDFGQGKVFARAQELYVTAELMPLLRGDVQVRSLELQQPQIELIRNAQGVWNVASLGRNAVAPATPPAGQTPEAQARARQQRSQERQPQQQARAKEFSLEGLRIRDGQVAVTDWQKRQGRALYDHIDLGVENFEPGKPFDVLLAAKLPGKGAQTVKLQARAGPIADGELLRTPIDGAITLNEVSLSAAQKFLNTSALQGAEAVASGEARIKNAEGKLESSGALKLEQPRIRGVEVGYPISADYNITGDLASDVIRIDKAALKLGGTPISITGVVNTRPTPSQIDLRVWTPDAPIAEIARLAAAFGVAFNPGTRIDGRIKADVQARGAADRPLLSGNVSASNLVITGKDLAQPVNVQGIELAMTPSVVRSNEFAATTGGTTVAVQFSLSQYTTPNPLVEATVRTSNAGVGEMLSIARAYGVSAVDGITGSGSAALDVRASGPLKNASAMTFAGNGALQNATLRLPALRQPLNIRMANIRFTQNAAVLENVSASVANTNASGTITIRDFASPKAQFALSADKLDLAELPNWLATRPAPAAAGASTSLLPQAHAQAGAPGAFDRMVGTGTIRVGTVLYRDLVLTNLRSNVTLDRGVIRVGPFVADVFGGVQSGNMVIDTRPTPFVYSVSSKLERVDANQLLSSVSSLKQTLFGLLAANASTNFTASGDQIARTLDGKLALNLNNGRIANMDLMYELASAGRFLATGRKMQPFTNLLSLAGNFDVQDGVARTDDLKAVIDGGTLAGAGWANLADQTLNMRVTAVLSKERSLEAGGTRVGGYMTTALANSKGELVIPVIVSGTFQNPRFAPDLEKIARMKLENLLPSASNPGALSTGILGAVLNQQKKGTEAAPDGQPQQGGMGGILDVVGGKKPQPQQPPPQQPQASGEPEPGQPPQQQPKKQDVWRDILNAVTQSQQKPTPTPSPSPQPPPDPPR